MKALRAISAKGGLVGGPFGSSLVSNDYTDDGVPVIRGTNLSHGRFVGGEFVYVSDEKVKRDLSRNIAAAGDIVFTQRGTLGQVALVPEGMGPLVISQSQMRLRVDSSIADARFIYYAASTASFRKQIADRSIATGVPHINLGILGKLEVPLPALSEQQAIAEVLGALDDKIAANIRLAEIVDDFLASYLGSLIVESTQMVELREIADVNSVTVKPTPGGSLRYVDIASVGVGAFVYPEVSSWDDAPGRARRKLRRGDTIWSTVRPNRRSHALNLSTDPLLVASTGLAVLTPRNVAASYLYETTKRTGFSSYLENVAEGSTYPAVRANRFSEAPVPLVDETSRKRFEALAESLRERAYAATQENRNLAATRDALLPQLMSGKLRVRGAEKIASEGGA